MAHKSKVIILIETPFLNEDRIRYGVDFFVQKQLNVEVWDCTPLFQPERKHNLFDRQANVFSTHSYTSLKKLNRAILNLDNSSVLIYGLGLNLAKYTLLCAIRASAASSVLLAPGGFPSIQQSQEYSGIFSRIKRVLNHPRNILEKIYFLFFLPRLRGLFRYYLYAGDCNKSHYSPLIDQDKTKSISVHSWDREIMISEMKKARYYGDRPFAVFLDQALSHHPDFITQKVKLSDHFRDQYYKLLDKFFNQVELKLGLKVIVAAHPKSDPQLDEDLFFGRRVVRGETASLVLQSNCVLAHYSLSINFAIIARKPLIFLDSTLFDGISYSAWIPILSRELDAPCFHLENQNFDFEELRVNEESYCRHEKDYIQSEAAYMSSMWEVFWTEYSRANGFK